MKNIETLVDDIKSVLSTGTEVPDELADAFGKSMAELVKRRFAPRGVREGTLRMSNMGKPDRQLWYEINKPEAAEKLLPATLMKFFIGDIIEEAVLFLAKLSGHDVKGEQDTMKLGGIVGHRDAVIDGVTVDVKSASPFSFEKFKGGLKSSEDPFGYTMQIQSYVLAAQDDDVVTDKTRGAFLVNQKVSGDLHLDIHKKTEIPILDIYEHKKEVVKLPEPPDRCFEPVPEGKSGNLKLNVNCSYCPFKRECWPGMRTFLYSKGPVFLVHVEREPDVYEVLDEVTVTED